LFIFSWLLHVLFDLFATYGAIIIYVLTDRPTWPICGGADAPKRWEIPPDCHCLGTHLAGW